MKKNFKKLTSDLFSEYKIKHKGYKGRGHGCTYGCFLLMYDRKPQNSESNYPSIKKNHIEYYDILVAK